MTITERIDAALDRAEAVYKSGEPTVKRKVEELDSVLAELIVAVKELDARENHGRN